MPELVQNFINPETQALIRRLDWSLSTQGFGQVAQGVDDISQCILLAVSTNKGSDPFRPDFGSDIWEHLDTPLPIAAPNIVLAITQAIERWETRISLTYINYTHSEQINDLPGVKSGLVFDIGWKLRGGNIEGQTDLLLGLNEDSNQGNTVPSTITIIVLGTEVENELIITEDSSVFQIT